MTYLDLIRDADRQLDDGRITIGEYEQMIEPMNREIHPEIFMPSAQPETCEDAISRRAAIDAINKLVDRFERILRDIRETNEDESVCGLCEYDGAFLGQSGGWCNECPGFDKADCFKLSDEHRKEWLKELDLPTAQPEPHWIPCSERLPEEGQKCLVCDKGCRYEKYEKETKDDRSRISC